MTPEQIATLLTGKKLHEIETFDLLRVTQRVEGLVRKGLLEQFLYPISVPSLRDERHLYRLTPFGRDEAGRTNSVPVRRALVSIEVASVSEGWAEESIVWEEAFTAYRERSAVRYEIRKLVRRGWVEEKIFPKPKTLRCFGLTSKGLTLLNQRRRKLGTQSILPTRSPRMDEAVHHLLTVQASLWVLLASKGRLVRLLGDLELRSQSRRGKRQSKSDEEKLPDGRLLYKGDGGEMQSVDIEILTSKYTDEQIVSKHMELAPQTLFFASTERLAERTLTLVGRKPLVL